MNRQKNRRTGITLICTVMLLSLALACQGVGGSSGSYGAKGDPGLPGLPGNPGIAGNAGEPGNPGAPGPQGAQGPQGAKGKPANLTYAAIVLVPDSIPGDGSYGGKKAKQAFKVRGSGFTPGAAYFLQMNVGGNYITLAHDSSEEITVNESGSFDGDWQGHRNYSFDAPGVYTVVVQDAQGVKASAPLVVTAVE